MFRSNTEFSIETRQIITTFKRVWRQNKINFLQNGLDLKEFQINRKQIQFYTDAELYAVVIDTIERIKIITQKPSSPLHEHKGLALFATNLKTFISQYKLHRGHVIHLGKYAGSLLLNIVQDLRSMSAAENASHTYDPLVTAKITTRIKQLKSLNQPHVYNSLVKSIKSLKSTHTALYSALSKHLGAIA